MGKSKKYVSYIDSDNRKKEYILESIGNGNEIIYAKEFGNLVPKLTTRLDEIRDKENAVVVIRNLEEITKNKIPLNIEEYGCIQKILKFYNNSLLKPQIIQE